MTRPDSLWLTRPDARPAPSSLPADHVAKHVLRRPAIRLRTLEIMLDISTDLFCDHTELERGPCGLVPAADRFRLLFRAVGSSSDWEASK